MWKKPRSLFLSSNFFLREVQLYLAIPAEKPLSPRVKSIGYEFKAARNIPKKKNRLDVFQLQK